MLNPILGVVLILAALVATYVFARAHIDAGAIVSACFGAGVVLLQGTGHVVASKQLEATTAVLADTTKTLAKLSNPPPAS